MRRFDTWYIDASCILQQLHSTFGRHTRQESGAWCVPAGETQEASRKTENGYAAADFYRSIVMRRRIPEAIVDIVGNQASWISHVGLSDPEVLIDPEGA